MSRLRKTDVLYIKRRVLLSILIVAVSISIWFPMVAVKMTTHHYRELPGGLCNVSLRHPSSRPIVALVSDTCTGSELTRYLLEMTTGVYTGSIEHNEELFRDGFLGEMEAWDSGTTLLLQMGADDVDEDVQLDATVLVMRNPYSLFLCQRNREAAEQNGDFASSEDTTKRDLQNEKDWEEFVTWHAPRWQETMTTLLTRNGPLLVVRYEDLEDDPEREVLRIVKYMNSTVDENRLQCIREDIDHRRFERFDARGTMELYSEELREIVDENIRGVSAILESMGSLPVRDVDH